jgi:hypothetical protein
MGQRRSVTVAAGVSPAKPDNCSRHGCLHFYFGAGAAASFWKRGSSRSGSNIGSSRSSAGVSGPAGKAPAYGLESSFCNAAMAWSGSLMCAATRARKRDQLARLSRSDSRPWQIFWLFFEKRFQFAAALVAHAVSIVTNGPWIKLKPRSGTSP